MVTETLIKSVSYLIVHLLHQFHHAPVAYPAMHHFVTEMCTCVHISVTKWCIVGYGTGALWDLWDGSISTACCWPRTIWCRTPVGTLMTNQDCSLCICIGLWYKGLFHLCLTWDQDACHIVDDKFKNIFSNKTNLMFQILPSRIYPWSYYMCYKLSFTKYTPLSIRKIWSIPLYLYKHRILNWCNKI